MRDHRDEKTCVKGATFMLLSILSIARDSYHASVACAPVVGLSPAVQLPQGVKPKV